VLLVVAVVVAAFLIAMGGVCGRVEVEQNLLRSPVFGAFSRVELEERFCHPVATTSVNSVLQARDGGLRGEIGTRLGQRSAHELEQRIGAKGIRVVLVLVTARYLEDALLEECHQGVVSFPLSPLRHVLGHGFAQAELFVGLSQPGEPTVARQFATVEGDLQREGRSGLKAQLACGTIFHRREPPLAMVESSNNPTIVAEALLLQPAS
jgi:hypothetical protein